MRDLIVTVACAGLLGLNIVSCANARDLQLSPDDRTIQRDSPQGDVALVQVRALVRVSEAQDAFKVNGKGCTAAVLDTGINSKHLDFGNRIVAQLNLTTDNGGNRGDATDGEGHGTNVAGIIAANDVHKGIAPEARIVAIKVLDNAGGGDFAQVLAALEWILENRAKHSICVANMSLGDSSNATSIGAKEAGDVGRLILQLRDAKVAVVVAAGNSYFTHKKPGMSFPAIVPQTISVGSVYDADLKEPQEYSGGARAHSTRADQIAVFSQRLPAEVGKEYRTDVFGPGAAVTSTGIWGSDGESTASGTSQAAPVVAGVVLLAQNYWRTKCKTLPSIDLVENWLREGTKVKDGDNEDDNAPHTNATYVRVDAMTALKAAEQTACPAVGN